MDLPQNIADEDLAEVWDAIDNNRINQLNFSNSRRLAKISCSFLLFFAAMESIILSIMNSESEHTTIDNIIFYISLLVASASFSTGIYHLTRLQSVNLPNLRFFPPADNNHQENDMVARMQQAHEQLINRVVEQTKDDRYHTAPAA